MDSRRRFLTGLGMGVGALAMLRADALTRVARAGLIAGSRGVGEVARDEDYWGEVRRAFDADRSVINLNHGGVAPAPTVVLEAQVRDIRFANAAPAHHLWDILEPRVESVRRDLAREFGCDPEEMAITRNASEGLQTLISGVDLKAGDEVVVTNQNYGRTLTAWDQRARRDGIVVRKISLPVPSDSPETIVERFRQALTPRTRVIEVTHVINWTGAVLPVKAIAAMARERGVETFVDGAHAFAQLPFRRDDLGCDYYAASLHKWLSAPIGTGLLYVRKAKVGKIWPLMAGKPEQTDDIRKFEEIGTHPAGTHNAIASALAFHRGIGADRKLARLRYLRDRWAGPVLQALGTKARLLSPTDDVCGSGIGMIQVDGADPRKIKERLWDKHKIITTAIVHDEFHGLRVTPNVDTSLDEVDTFAAALIAVQG